MKLELRGVTKSFGSLVANDHIDLTVNSGEIHCLLGENGAGKSTLMNVLYGLYRADSGHILLDGVPQDFTGPGDAMRAGIGMVHQHFMLVPAFTVAENVILGHEETRLGFLDRESARERVVSLARRFGFHLDPDAVVEHLPVGVQQRVEIIKALSRDARVLIFDEPTAVLTPQETTEFMAIVEQLRDEGAAIVFITHKLAEVRTIADRITIMRSGKIVCEASPSASNAELAALMVGRDVQLTVDKKPAVPGPVTLSARDLTVVDARDQKAVNGVTFDIAAGEIFAIAGVQGNGQTEITESILGLRPHTYGSITFAGQEIVGWPVHRVLDAGVGFVPEDRGGDGLVENFTIAENLMLDRYRTGPFVRRGAIRRSRVARFAREKITEFDIRATNHFVPVGHLSGGNQQKVIIARELSRDLKLLVIAQPTRGVDVGSIEFIHKRIVEARDRGVAVLLVSSELDEVLALADRIAVMYRGEIVGIVPAGTPRDVLGLMMAGDESGRGVAA